jgi:hypothetical protein
VQAIKSRDRTATLAVLGNAGEWMSSGDATADRAAAERFVAAYEAKHAIGAGRRQGDADDRRGRVPIRVSRSSRAATGGASILRPGARKLLARRIGANELDTIKVLQAIVDAEREYASQDRNGDGVFTYAQKVRERTGQTRRALLADERQAKHRARSVL